MQQIDFKKVIYDWITTIDLSIESLSNHYEGKLWSLPKWVLSKRKIKCYILPYDGIVLIIESNNFLSVDEYTQEHISDLSMVQHNNFKPSGSFQGFDPIGFMSIFEMRLSDGSGISQSNCIDDFIGYGKIAGFLNVLTIDEAKNLAINFWNSAEASHEFSRKKISFPDYLAGCFDKFSAIVRRKSFLERKIHRYINQNRVLLPSHNKCHFEHIISNEKSVYKADFILENEYTFPALLIELESPVHRVFTKNMGLTAEANHAVDQINDWVYYIDSLPDKNANSDMRFLLGEKNKLIIIGRGLEHKEELFKQKFKGTMVWTYDILLHEAKRRWEKILAEQYRIIGINTVVNFN